MIITNGTTSITLPDDMNWIDEFSYSPVLLNIEYAVSGLPVLDEWQKVNGRPITLEGADDRSWVYKTIVDDLIELNKPNTIITLTLADSRVFSVRFDNSSGSAIDAIKIIKTFPHDNSDYFYLKIKFISL